jgi:phosphatidylglycerophosphate synthase
MTKNGSYFSFSPNLITLLGFIGIIIAYLVLVVWYASNMNETAPGWAYLLAAGAIFFYQTMDALDGKQARRTGTFSLIVILDAIGIHFSK